ncbi:hypothetical protein BJY21_003277 [Kineosphaera limosa]|uniref:DUF1541 domain-containing protein n=1 Tax=Kineosphaera limosa NBRC 100340 TaxID=1184609 RepID=K6W810_9MICO|nr:YdhK family protein [Kineosphaera limosa]NYE02093.1 hypothetical protein [Kineosphaera limosa]GAB95305.1 hypothetical protein KILIM_018_00520 [Kineosphaera limosa NBRC 100340]
MNTARARGIVAAGALGMALLLNGCSADVPADSNSTAAQGHGGHGGHGGADHPADGGPVPADMAAAASPRFPVGSQVTLTADHLDGMVGARATVVGAYDTYTYAVDFTPTTGGGLIEDHRWVVQEEISDAGDERLADGTEVRLAAAHMDGMDGAAARIARSTDETVYVVDFEADGMKMTNHKWVVESEMQPTS